MKYEEERFQRKRMLLRAQILFSHRSQPFREKYTRKEANDIETTRSTKAIV